MEIQRKIGYEMHKFGWDSSDSHGWKKWVESLEMGNEKR